MTTLKTMRNYPMQPIVMANDGVVRFKENRIVSAFMDAAAAGKKLDLADIAIRHTINKEFTNAEMMQFNMLIGYSVSGFGDLSTSSEEVVRYSDEIAEKLSS